MTLPSDDRDRDLAEFLRHNRPEPPAAEPELRSQILAAIATEAASTPESASAPEANRFLQPRRSRKRLLWWLLPPAVAAAMLGSFWPRPIAFEVADLSELEDFLVASWGGSTAIGTDPLEDWLADSELADEQLFSDRLLGESQLEGN